MEKEHLGLYDVYGNGIIDVFVYNHPGLKTEHFDFQLRDER